MFCIDSAIESIVFKLCLLSSLFIEYHALPTRPGKTEIKMILMAFAMRSNIYFKIMQTFIQRVWQPPENYYVTRDDFVLRMS